MASVRTALPGGREVWRLAALLACAGVVVVGPATSVAAARGRSTAHRGYHRASRHRSRARVAKFAYRLHSAGALRNAPRGIVPVRIPATARRASSGQRNSRATAHAAAVSTFPTGFESLVSAYLANVAADSTKFTNVYSVATQYWDGSSMSPTLVSYGSSFGGSVVDTDPAPTTSGCSDPAVPPDSPCLTDLQMASEIDRVVTSQGWPRGLEPIYFLLTPPGFGSCFDSNPADGCYAYAGGYCGYHADFTANSVETIYSIIPFDDLPGCRTGTSQSTPDHPNGNSADDAVNIISHEQNEAITDPVGASPAWYSNQPTTPGEEIGDICASNYTPQTGTPAYNQTINGTHYELQQESSNDDGKCMPSEGSQPATASTLPTSTLTYHGGPVLHTNKTFAIYWEPGPAPSATLSASPGPYYPGHPVTFSATPNYAGATLHWDFGDGATASGPSVTHSYAAAGNYSVSVTASFDQATGTPSTQAISVIDAAPSASFAASTLSAQTRQTVAFNAAASNDVDGGALTYSWNFGDGQTATGGPIANHAYATPGQKTVTLTVTDPAGLSASATQAVAVTPSAVLEAVIAGRRQTRKSALARGLSLDVTCSDACNVSGRALLQMPVKRKGHHARSKTMELGQASSGLAAPGTLRLTIHFGRAGKQQLRRLPSPAVTVIMSASHIGFGPVETNSTKLRLSG